VTRVLCLHCGSTYDLGHVETVARYADCAVYITPCCKRQVDDRKWVPSPAFRELSADEASRLVSRTAPTAAAIGIRDDGEDWRHRAACLDSDPELFYAAEGERANARPFRVALAQSVCRTCPVQRECLTDALQHNDAWAVRGGIDLSTMSPRSRLRLRRAEEAA
jgi:WhiB family redox-sensing transcriptional regulator